MFFFVDESGNSGLNLFDQNQPFLSYGVLTSDTNPDALATGAHRRMIKALGVDALHANMLKQEGILKILPDLFELQRKFDFRLDVYVIEKRAYAVVMLFDAIFDASLNPAVPWHWYWTPLKFPVIATLQSIIDEAMLKEAWDLRCTSAGRIHQHEARIVALLKELRARASKLKDKGFRKRFDDALAFGIGNPLSLDFGSPRAKALSPNAVGFQFVLSSVATQTKSRRRRALGIVVDRQTQFNSAQLDTYDFYERMATAMKASPKEKHRYLQHPFLEGVRSDSAALFESFPTEKVTISPSDASMGLQLVDVWLWLATRELSGGTLEEPLRALLWSALRRGRIDGIFFKGMYARWQTFEKQLPAIEDISPEQAAFAQKILRAHNEKLSELGISPTGEQ